MYLTKRNSRNHRPTFNSLIDGLLQTDFNNCTPSKQHIPAVNIIESEEAFNIEVALPGISKKEVSIDVDEKILTISREVKEEKTEDGETKIENPVKYTRKEFSFQSFKRSFTLPDSIETNSISASAKDGILVISLPKKEESKAVKKTIKIS